MPRLCRSGPPRLGPVPASVPAPAPVPAPVPADLSETREPLRQPGHALALGVMQVDGKDQASPGTKVSSRVRSTSTRRTRRTSPTSTTNTSLRSAITTAHIWRTRCSPVATYLTRSSTIVESPVTGAITSPPPLAVARSVRACPTS